MRVERSERLNAEIVAGAGAAFVVQVHTHYLQLSGAQSLG